MNTKLRIISDVHGKYDRYLKLANESPSGYSLQVGDMGFDYLPLNKLDPSKHQFFGGNHDNYDVLLASPYLCSAVPHNIGDYGVYVINGIQFFFVRGALSIDKVARRNYEFKTGQRVWWQQEELSYKVLADAIKLYTVQRPQLVITHTCPRQIANIIGNPDVLRNFGHDPDTFTEITGEALQAMFDIHKPKRWIFGHFHKKWSDTIDGCEFTCLPELGYIDI